MKIIKKHKIIEEEENKIEDWAFVDEEETNLSFAVDTSPSEITAPSSNPTIDCKFSLYSTLDIDLIDASKIDKMQLELLDNMEGYPPTHRDPKSSNVIDHCDVYMDTKTNHVHSIWKTSGLNERMSQMSFYKLKNNDLMWSIGEKEDFQINLITDSNEYLSDFNKGNDSNDILIVLINRFRFKYAFERY